KQERRPELEPQEACAQPFAGKKGVSYEKAYRASCKRRHQTHADERHRSHLQELASLFRRKSNGMQGDGDHENKASGEPTTGIVVASKEQEQREQDLDGYEVRRHGTKDQGVHRPLLLRTAARSRDTIPMAATASTVISPSVSRTRKSTRMTFTTLLP